MHRLPITQLWYLNCQADVSELATAYLLELDNMRVDKTPVIQNLPQDILGDLQEDIQLLPLHPFDLLLHIVSVRQIKSMAEDACHAAKGLDLPLHSSMKQ